MPWSEGTLDTEGAMLEAIRHARLPMCITDPRQPDNPIVFANPAFAELTGYAPEDVIGRNCRFLQGEETTRESIDAIRQIIREQTVGTVEIVNYRKDGSSFVNALQLGPILDAEGELLYYFGSQLDVSLRNDIEQQARALADRELLHRLRNIVNVMSAIIRKTVQEEHTSSDLTRILIGRLDALGKAHFDTIERPRQDVFGIDALAGKLIGAYAPRGVAQFDLRGERFDVPPALIAPITLLLHELAANAVKHGALRCPDGKVVFTSTVRPSEHGDAIDLHWQEHGGPTVTAPQSQSGSAIVRDIVAASGGTVDFDWKPAGLVVTASFAS